MTYHDYVFKDGALVGQFDEMYRACADPWWQSKMAHTPMRLAMIGMLKQAGVKSVIEWGCGLGYYSEVLAGHGFDVTGVDISPTAIQHASARVPSVRFVTDDVTHVDQYPADAILFAELTWYILPRLEEVFQALRTAPAQYFGHLLTFYPPGQQQYGRNWFTTLDECQAKCPLTLKESAAHHQSDPTASIQTASLFSIPPRTAVQR